MMGAIQNALMEGLEKLNANRMFIVNRTEQITDEILVHRRNSCTY